MAKSPSKAPAKPAAEAEVAAKSKPAKPTKSASKLRAAKPAAEPAAVSTVSKPKKPAAPKAKAAPKANASGKASSKSVFQETSEKISQLASDILADRIVPTIEQVKAIAALALGKGETRKKKPKGKKK